MRPQLLSDEKIGGVESDQTENPEKSYSSEGHQYESNDIVGVHSLPILNIHMITNSTFYIIITSLLHRDRKQLRLKV